MIDRGIGAVRFYFTGHAGFYNRGCEAIVRSTIDLLHEVWTAPDIVLYSYDPQNDLLKTEDMNIRIRSSKHPPFSIEWFTEHILKWIPEIGVSLAQVVGMSPFPAMASLSIGGDNYSLDYSNPLRFIFKDRLMMSSGIPVVIWGASIGPFEKHPRIKSLMKEHFQAVNLITARESATVGYLKYLGITRNVVQVYDSAFGLKAEPCDGPENIFMDSGSVVGLNISSLIVSWRPDRCLESFLNEVAGFVNAAVAEGFKILLVPHVIQENGDISRNDAKTLALVQQLLQSRENVALLPGSLSARQLKWFISRCRFFIGARTHSTIAAISSCVPTVSIAYSQKARGINRDVCGHERYVLETPRVSAHTLLDKLKLLQRNEDSIRSHLKDKQPEMLMGARRNVEALAELLV